MEKQTMKRVKHEGTLSISGQQLPCFVLEGDIRTVCLQGMVAALDLFGKNASSEQELSDQKQAHQVLLDYVQKKNIRRFLSKELLEHLHNPFKFTSRRFGFVYGCKALALLEIALAVTDARACGRLENSYAETNRRSIQIVIASAIRGTITVEDAFRASAQIDRLVQSIADNSSDCPTLY